MKKGDNVVKKYGDGGFSGYAISDTDYSILLSMRVKMEKPTNLSLLKLITLDLMAFLFQIRKDM